MTASRETPDPTRAADSLREAADTMRAVRERCVWSQRITHDDLVPYLVEESAELVDAVVTEAGVSTYPHAEGLPRLLALP